MSSRKRRGVDLGDGAEGFEIGGAGRLQVDRALRELRGDGIDGELVGAGVDADLVGTVLLRDGDVLGEGAGEFLRGRRCSPRPSRTRRRSAARGSSRCTPVRRSSLAMKTCSGMEVGVAVSSTETSKSKGRSRVFARWRYMRRVWMSARAVLHRRAQERLLVEDDDRAVGQRDLLVEQAELRDRRAKSPARRGAGPRTSARGSRRSSVCAALST